MAGHKASLLSLQSKMNSVLEAAKTFMSPAQERSATAFLQAPFTGTYTSQSAVVMGIIKSMRDTFEANLDSARDTEEKQEREYKDFMKLKEDAHKEMSDSYDEKQK